MPSVHTFTKEELAEFTRKIVEKCAKIADAKYHHDAGCGYITKTIGTRIREHFDIK
jgi:hypothetical protein